MIDTAKLERIMKRDRWNTFNLSIAARVPQGTIYRTLKGRSVPRVDTLQKICETLGISVSEILIPETEKSAA